MNTKARSWGRSFSANPKAKTQVVLSADLEDILRINEFCTKRRVTRSRMMVMAALKVIDGEAA